MTARTHTAPRPRKSAKRFSGRIIGRMVAGLIIGLVFITPYLIMLVGSFKSRRDILAVPPTYLPKSWHPENYLTMWSTPETPVPQNLISTIVISVFATALAMILCVPAAYYAARFRFPGRNAFLFLVVVTQMLQPTVLATGLFKEFVTIGINDTWLAMILINGAFNMTFAIWIMYNFFAGVPKEIDEAARIDGAGKLTALFKVHLPLVWPGIVTAVVYTFVASWNEFAASLVIMNTAGNQPLSVALTKFVGQYDSAWQYVFGVSIVAILPVIVLFMLIEKRLVGGLTAGSVK